MGNFVENLVDKTFNHRTTCSRLKTIADRTAVGRIAYLLRKSEPLWARLHRGAIRHGLRTATSILEYMEGT